MPGTIDPPPDAAFLTTTDGSGCWTWAGVRLSAEGRIDATQRYTDLSWDERRKRLSEQETAWLAAQWDTPAPGSRFEVRFAAGAKAGKVQAAFLVRVLAAAQEEARRLAGERLRRAAGRGGVLPPHVGARPIDSEAELRAWLGYPGHVESFVEVRKHLSANRIARGGTAQAYAVCHGFFDSGAAWDAWWRSFAALPFPAVLSIGFDPYDADNPAFRAVLRRRAADLDELASQGVPSPLNPYRVPPDQAAQAAVPGYHRALARYAGRCFSVRVVVASAQPLPPTLVESLVGTVSSTTGAARAVHVGAAELYQAAAEFQALGAPWLPAAYQSGLPVGLDTLDRLLHSLADVPEAASVLALPVHWPGMPPVFDRDSGPLPAC
ncbi:MAG TPA: hypothetical protein VNV62_11380 [Trebonia sp.]|nr:hypothetical protein [Trebonia sp.]